MKLEPSTVITTLIDHQGQQRLHVALDLDRDHEQRAHQPEEGPRGAERGELGARTRPRRRSRPARTGSRAPGSGRGPAPARCGPRMNSASMLKPMCQIWTWVNIEVSGCQKAPSATPSTTVGRPSMTRPACSAVGASFDGGALRRRRHEHQREDADVDRDQHLGHTAGQQQARPPSPCAPGGEPGAAATRWGTGSTGGRAHAVGTDGAIAPLAPDVGLPVGVPVARRRGRDRLDAGLLGAPSRSRHSGAGRAQVRRREGARRSRTQRSVTSTVSTTTGCRTVHGPGLGGGDGVDDVAGGLVVDLTEDRVFMLRCGRPADRDEELRPVGARASVGHG